jgi:hypothetical protein
MIRPLLLLGCLLAAAWQPAWAQETVTLPLLIDYGLLRSLVTAAAFTDEGSSAVLADDSDGCTEVRVSDPRFGSEGRRIRFETRVQLRTGTPLGDNCLMPMAWEGYLALIQRPVIDTATWQLSFQTVDSALYDSQHQPAKIADLVWQLIKSWVYDYLDQITVNLAPPISDLKGFLLPLFPEEMQAGTRHMLDSMRPGAVYATAEGLRAEIVTDILPLFTVDTAAPSEPIGSEEFERLIAVWEAWDTFLIEMIITLAEAPLTEEDRALLLEVLLETRHRFVSELQEEKLGRDLVREQFVDAWRRLAPLFRKHLGSDPSGNVLGYLAFFTASDALVTLDKLGPAIGVEISRNGLVRLAQMLKEGDAVMPYDRGVNSTLREIFGFDPLPAASEGETEREEIELPAGEVAPQSRSGGPGTFSLLSFLLPPVWAKGTRALPTLAEMRKWLVPKQGINDYLKRVKALLQKATADVLKKARLTEPYRRLFRQIVLSTAWQESCYRQFTVKKNKLTYLRSYNGTSVGLMQINERVWRGLYDMSLLRWDIAYNAKAGCEILERYIRNYALKELQRIKPAADRNLAGIVYAMYNGGPGQFAKYLERSRLDKYYRSDRLFAEKFVWVKSGSWQQIGKCLVGG